MTPRRLFFYAVLMAFGATAAPAQEGTAPPAIPTAGTVQSQTVQSQKVWTNDNLAAAPATDETPAATNPRAIPGETGRKPAAKGRNAQWYHAQIARLQAQLPPIDSQIAALRSAIDGTPTGDGKTSQRPRAVKGGSWSAELAQLQVKRDDITGKINALRDEARHNGVVAGELP